MSEQAGGPDYTFGQKAGLAIFVLCSGIPALEANGFGFGIPFTFETALACAALGGVIGGALLCPKSRVAGLAGGLLAGILGMVAVHYYIQGRDRVSKFELILVQGAASLPGILVGYVLYKVLGPKEAAPPQPPPQSPGPAA